jgi:hypothetical protein
MGENSKCCHVYADLEVVQRTDHQVALWVAADQVQLLVLGNLQGLALVGHLDRWLREVDYSSDRERLFGDEECVLR